MKKILIILSLLCAGAPAFAEPATEPAVQTAARPDSSVKVRAVAGGVEIANAAEESCHVVIVALTGQVVTQEDVPGGVTTIDLPPGYYIVRAGTVTAKVAVR